MRTITIASILLVCLMGHNGRAQDTGAQFSPTQTAKEFVDQLVQGDYSGCVAHFDSTVTRFLPEPKVKEMWDKLLEQVGSFKGQAGVRTQKYKVYDLVFVTCQFERDTLDMKIVLDAGGKIAGLFFVPTAALPLYQSPLYVKRDSFREEDVTIGSGQWALPGSMTLPIGTGPFRAIVLVHGSGPNDRDETIGPNKPFRDLAWGLASKRIAVLRYEKRTREHAGEMLAVKNTLTVKEETIDDAIAAFSLLRRTKEVDSNRVYILGHSLGATLLPRIGRLDQRISGFVLLAGATRPLEDLMLEQYTYIYSLDTVKAHARETQLAEVKRQADKVKSLKGSGSDSSESLLSIPVSYWLDLKGYNPAGVARTLSIPMLVLQGGRDYQVTVNDYEGWKASLGRKSAVTFKLYPKLNHLFIEGVGKSTPSEYDIPGHIAEYVIVDIADWINK